MLFLCDIENAEFKRKTNRRYGLLSPSIVGASTLIGAGKGLLSKQRRLSGKGALIGLASGVITDQSYKQVIKKRRKASFASFAEEKVKVKSFVRKGRLVKSYNRMQDKADQKNNTGRNLGMLIGGLGVTAAGFLALKGRYVDGISKSAKVALEKAKTIQVPDLKPSELQRPNIHFTVGGLWYTPETRNSKQIASMVENRFKGHTVAVDTSGYNVLGTKEQTNPVRVVFDMKYPNARAFLNKGYNPSSRDLAAQAFAYHKKYPNQTLVLHGHSSGGTITNESMLILEKMGVDMSKVKQVTYGANNYGILPSAKNSMHIVDRNDIQAQPFTFPNPTLVNPKKKKTGKTIGEKLIEDHGISHYMGSDEARSKIKDFITPKDWKPPAIDTSKKKASEKIISSNPAEDQKRLLQEARKSVREKTQKLRKLRSNQNIPADKRASAEEQATKSIRTALQEYRTRQRKLRESR